ncbi:MAG: hypothetical protein LBG88_03815 [Christensenellaceae bacterium]|nr:hypothetical protein [Christensenellaceae bacterium]
MEQDENLGQLSAVDGEGPKSEFGKFDNLDNLLRAYEQLEQRFTWKCQEMAEMTDKQGQASVAVNKAPIAPDEASRDEIIKEYLTSIATRTPAPTVITGQSDFVIGAKAEAKSLRDMEKVAENYFKTKEK